MKSRNKKKKRRRKSNTTEDSFRRDSNIVVQNPLAGRLHLAYTVIMVNQSHYRPGVTQRFPGSYGYQIS